MDMVCHNYVIFESNGNEKIIGFNITKSYQRHERANIYECTRKYWRLDVRRAKNADLALGICSGIIIGVFKPLRWYKSEGYPGRWEFDGEEIENSPYLNMDISAFMGKRQNPVMYINM